MSNKLTDYSYEFPEELIALHPTPERSASRLMVLDRKTESIAHHKFSNITEFLNPGDALVINDSKVFPCRLITKRKSGGRQEILLLRSAASAQVEEVLSPGMASGRDGQHKLHFEHAEVWYALVNAGAKVKGGDSFDFDGLRITMLDEGLGERRVLVKYNGDLMARLELLADIPLPPYIKRANEKSDRERYQTVYAKDVGSTAAPTAGLHFTEKLLDELRQKGVIVAKVTLHVGPGTFLPVRSDDVSEHKMHTEFYSINAETCDAINRVKGNGGRVIAVGTTAARVLESVANKGLPLKPQSGTTDIFIRPPYQFKIIDALVTNFHQPESTLLMLVSAFAGREFILKSYAEAIQNKYRLFSYGDAMMII